MKYLKFYAESYFHGLPVTDLTPNNDNNHNACQVSERNRRVAKKMFTYLEAFCSQGVPTPLGNNFRTAKSAPSTLHMSILGLWCIVPQQWY